MSNSIRSAYTFYFSIFRVSCPRQAIRRTVALLTTVCFALMLTASPAWALTKDEIQGLSALVIHSRNDDVKAAWRLLVDKGVIKEGPEKQWQLYAAYPRERHPEIAEAIVVLQEEKILSAHPINWEGTDNAVEILLDADEIYPRALEMINRATRTIRFNIFLWGGEIGQRLVDAFVAARDRGVSVQIITQPDGSGAGILDKLKKISAALAGDEPLPPYKPVKQQAIDAGLEIGFFPVKKLNGKAFVKADHNKVLIVDGVEAMTGGMNFADVISGNHDLMLWMKGPAVTELNRVFVDNWRLCRKVNEMDQSAEALWNNDEVLDAATERLSRDLARVTVTVSNAFVNATRGLVSQLIDESKSKIRIMMFTLTDDVIVDKIVAAHERGVDVKVLLDPNVHAFGLRLMGAPNISTVRLFKKKGIEVRAYKTKPGNQMHIKSAMFDDRYTLFGSTNWTSAGFDCNNETYVSVDSADVAEDFQALFDLDWEDNSYVLETDGFGRWLLSGATELFDAGF